MTSWGALGLVSRRVRRGVALSWSALFVLSLLLQYFSFALASPVGAVHDEGLFELDGNAVASSGTPGDDWNLVKSGGSSAESTKFIVDPVNSDADDSFTGGSTKDDIDIPSWLWKKAKASQAKNDITHAFAAGYTGTTGDTAGHTIIYFGLNKFDASGDNFVGFWFLQGAVAPTGSGAAPGSHFSGAHRAGDILVLADYTNGGDVSTFSVYQWVASGGNAGTHLHTVATGVPCTGAPATDDACGSTNTDTESAPWDFKDKSGSTDFLPGEFFEGGIDLTALHLDDGCFTSFIAETRASQSVDATLSDFASGTFSFCVAPTIATQVEQGGTSLGSVGGIDTGESVTDTATLTGTKGTVTGTVDFSVCFSATAAPDCSTGGTAVGGAKTLSGGKATSAAFTPDAVGFYCFRVDYTPAAGSKYLADSHTNKTTECFRVLPAQVTIAKTADAATATAGDPIGFTLSWGNSGAGKATGVVVTDSLPGAGGLDWSIDGSTDTGSTCKIAGAVGSQVVTCNVGDIAAKTAVSGTVHVTSDTTADACGTVNNTGHIASTNDGSANALASVRVQCPSDLTIQKSVAGNTNGTDPDLHVPSAKIGDTLTYTLAYSGFGPIHNAVITDDVPAGLAFIAGSACVVASAPLPCDTTDPNFQFVGVVGGVLTWQAAALPDPASGSVTFKVTVLTTAAEQPQPIVNTGTIDSDDTPPDSDTAAIAVLAPPEALTPPPTSTVSPEIRAGNPGFSLMLVLLAMAGVVLALGLVTPTPTRLRDRRRR